MEELKSYIKYYRNNFKIISKTLIYILNTRNFSDDIIVFINSLIKDEILVIPDMLYISCKSYNINAVKHIQSKYNETITLIHLRQTYKSGNTVMFDYLLGQLKNEKFNADLEIRRHMTNKRDEFTIQNYEIIRHIFENYHIKNESIFKYIYSHTNDEFIKHYISKFL